MTDNVQLQRFLDTVRGEGFGLTLNWEAKRWKRDAGRVLHYTVQNGPEGREPVMRTIVIVDYGRGNGYSLYGEQASAQITDDVAAVTGVPADAVSLVA